MSFTKLIQQYSRRYREIQRTDSDPSLAKRLSHHRLWSVLRISPFARCPTPEPMAALASAFDNPLCVRGAADQLIVSLASPIYKLSKGSLYNRLPENRAHT